MNGLIILSGEILARICENSVRQISKLSDISLTALKFSRESWNQRKSNFSTHVSVKIFKKEGHVGGKWKFTQNCVAIWPYKNKYLQCSSQNSLSDSSIYSTVDKMEPNNSLINIFIYKLPLLKLFYIFYLSLLFYLIFITHFTLVTSSFGEFFNILSWNQEVILNNVTEAAIQRCSIEIGCNFIKKETLAQVFSCEFCEIFRNTFFTEHLWTTASEVNTARIITYGSS